MLYVAFYIEGNIQYKIKQMNYNKSRATLIYD